MQKPVQYAIFSTEWGYFGLAGTDNSLMRTQLPSPNLEQLKSNLLSNIKAALYNRHLFDTLQQHIKAYFKGAYVNFPVDIPVALNGFSSFAVSILTECRNITFGRTASYKQLAKKAGCPKAVRAVGTVMAANPLPLIIPCHRIIRSDGRLSGFSAPGGIKLKKRMLELEKQTTKK